MKRKIINRHYIFMAALAGLFTFGCIDNMPEIEDLPSAAVAFTYEVVDDSISWTIMWGQN